MSTLQTSGPISFDDVSHAINLYTSGTPPQISMSQMYKSTSSYFSGFSPIAWNNGLPTSGQISMDQLYNKSMQLYGTWIGGYNSTTNATSYTFSVPVGASTTGNRRIIIVVGGHTSAAGLTISDVSLSGLYCPQHTFDSISPGTFLGIYSTTEDALTTVSIVVTLSQTATRCAISVYTLENDQGGYGTTPFIGKWTTSRSSFSVATSGVTTTPGYTLYAGINSGTPNPTWLLPDGSTLAGGDYAVNIEATNDFTTLGLFTNWSTPLDVLSIPLSVTLSAAATSGIIAMIQWSS